MMTGLNITINEFNKLPTTQKLNCLYMNQCETIRLMGGYKLYQKVSAIIGGTLVLGMGILFKMHLGL